MAKITRVRTGCWTCKKRHRKCDETKPICINCSSSNRDCEGYEFRLNFGVADLWSLGRKEKTSAFKKDTKKLSRGVDQDLNKVYPPRIRTTLSSAEIELPSKRAETISTIPSINLSASDAPGHAISRGEVALDVKKSISNARLFNNLNTKFDSENLEQFSFELFEDLEYLLKPAELESLNIRKSRRSSHSLHPNVDFEPNAISLDKDIIDFMNRSNLFGGKERLVTSELGKIEGSVALTYEEENTLLKHFFKKLLPLLDAHPNSPWPDLALEYCDFDVARSCFIALACIHMYESQKGEIYYTKGMAHINVTMEHLISNISTSGENSTSETTIAEKRKKQVSSFAILVLINVHILFAVLEKGKSSIVRFFFRVFASICQDSEFYGRLMENEKKRSLVVVLSWYDTISAIVSPDCRLPYCSPTWYGSSKELISTSKMMGCPGEIFRAMSKLCFIRHDAHNNIKKDREELLKEYRSLKTDLLRYRDYVSIDDDGSEGYYLRLSCAQCWSLAVHVTLARVVKPTDYMKLIRKDVLEFINVYGSMESSSPMVTQMVWPIYAIGCECKSQEEQKCLLSFMDTLYQNAQMGTLFSLSKIVQQVWQQGITQEEYLKSWLDENIDYLPL